MPKTAGRVCKIAQTSLRRSPRPIRKSIFSCSSSERNRRICGQDCTAAARAMSERPASSLSQASTGTRRDSAGSTNSEGKRSSSIGTVRGATPASSRRLTATPIWNTGARSSAGHCSTVAAKADGLTPTATRNSSLRSAAQGSAERMRGQSETTRRSACARSPMPLSKSTIGRARCSGSGSPVGGAAARSASCLARRSGTPSDSRSDTKRSMVRGSLLALGPAPFPWPSLSSAASASSLADSRGPAGPLPSPAEPAPSA
mmetsp:Transcript_2194/g.5187  ORF Transcript_2194/g.5187 Transcript_2194/m.5187 type:complete len:259 (+) Transcript_2194:648-1424(+)